MNTIKLELPASPKYILPLRLFMAGVAVRMDFPVDQIEDIKMAVSEACTILLNEEGKGTLSCHVLEEEGLCFEIAVTEGKEEVEEDISRIILEAIADDCTFQHRDGNCIGVKVCFQL